MVPGAVIKLLRVIDLKLLVTVCTTMGRFNKSNNFDAIFMVGDCHPTTRLHILAHIT